MVCLQCRWVLLNLTCTNHTTCLRCIQSILSFFLVGFSLMYVVIQLNMCIYQHMSVLYTYIIHICLQTTIVIVYIQWLCVLVAHIVICTTHGPWPMIRSHYQCAMYETMGPLAHSSLTPDQFPNVAVVKTHTVYQLCILWAFVCVGLHMCVPIVFNEICLYRARWWYTPRLASLCEICHAWHACY